MYCEMDNCQRTRRVLMESATPWFGPRMCVYHTLTWLYAIYGAAGSTLRFLGGEFQP